MILTIDFYNELVFQTNKIDDKIAYNVLTLECYPQTICSQISPKQSLCFCRVVLVVLCMLSQQTIKGGVSCLVWIVHDTLVSPSGDEEGDMSAIALTSSSTWNGCPFTSLY